jgi:hypothetical protein
MTVSKELHASDQGEFLVLYSESITHLNTRPHVNRNKDTYIPTTDQVSTQITFYKTLNTSPTHYYTTSFAPTQAPLHRTTAPTTQASDRVRPTPSELAEHQN